MYKLTWVICAFTTFKKKISFYIFIFSGDDDVMIYMTLRTEDVLYLGCGNIDPGAKALGRHIWLNT